MESVWRAKTQKPEFKAMNGDIKTDVLVIGAGITGILCGYMLKNAGVDCIIADANTVCGGVTQNTTAKITFHHGAIFDKMTSRFGTDFVKGYIDSQSKALDYYKNICKSIDCDFKEESSFVYSLDNRKKIEKEVSALNKAGCKAEYAFDLPLPLFTAGAVQVKNQAQFNPLKFAYSIAKDLNVFENTKIFEVTNDGAVTSRGKIKAEKIIVATHFPFINKYGGYSFKMYQSRSYVIALANAQNVGGMYIDEADKGLSFRNYGDLLLLGGGDHRTGKNGGNWRVLRAFASKNYPEAIEMYHWAAQDCITPDDISYIGLYSKKTPNLYVATGFNKWGMTSAMTAAMLLCDLITGKKNEYEEIYSPARSILRPQFFINGAETFLSLITPTVPRCSHLGCALKYNKDEHSWDCSCHGSRFDKNGKLLDNPATADLKQQ